MQTLVCQTGIFVCAETFGVTLISYRTLTLISDRTVVVASMNYSLSRIEI
jgi:hypothetical protein